jgi:hypothetical protein
MIPKQIPRKPENDNYRALAMYAADAKTHGKTDGEKTLMSWYEGCLAEDYQTAIKEVELTQAMNTRTKKEKTYHLMVSFRPEDEAKLTPEIFKDIEKTLAESIGFSEHQRHCGVHKNTDNLHMHIAFNMINPKNFNRHAPFYDHRKLHKTCRDLEKKYGLKPDKGIDKNTPIQETKTNIKAQAFEVHHGQESFNTFAIGKKETILRALHQAKNWKDFHAAVLKMGLEIKTQTTGVVFQDRFGKHRVKGSDIDRHLSKKQMEKVLGSFVGADKETLSTIKSTEKYNARPLHQAAAQGDLYSVFLAEMEQRKAALEAVKMEEQKAFNCSKEKWETKKKAIAKYAMLPEHRQQLLEATKAREDADLVKNRITLAEKRKAIREATPYTSWTKFLQHKAAQGDEKALEVLRSKKLKPELTTDNFNSKIMADLEAVKNSKERQIEILERHGLSRQHRRALVTVAKMQEVAAKNPDLKTGELQYKIDSKGVVIFSLASGGTIRDTGAELHFSGHDPAAKKLAEGLATVKWGRSVSADGGVLRRAEQERNRGMGR